MKERYKERLNGKLKLETKNKKKIKKQTKNSLKIQKGKGQEKKRFREKK